MVGHCFVLFLMLRWVSWILKSGTGTRGLKTRLPNARRLDSGITVARTKVFSYPSNPCRLRYVCTSIICVTQRTARFPVYNQFQHRATTADVHLYRFEMYKLVFSLFWKKDILMAPKRSLCVLIFLFLWVFSLSVFISWRQCSCQTFPVAMALTPDPQWHLQCHFL